METEKLDIRNCDCMELMKEFPDGYFDLAIVDPPYFKEAARAGKFGTPGVCSKTGVKRGGYSGFKSWEVPGIEYFDELLRVSKEQIIWGINYYAILNLGPGRIIWDKCNTASSFSDAEIAYCSSIRGTRIIKYMWNGMMQGKQSDGEIPEGNKKLNEKRIHPTQKPVALYQRLLGTYADPAASILDTHLGSGSIAIATHYAGLHLTACELDPHYFSAASERIKRETAQMTLPITSKNISNG